MPYGMPHRVTVHEYCHGVGHPLNIEFTGWWGGVTVMSITTAPPPELLYLTAACHISLNYV